MLVARAAPRRAACARGARYDTYVRAVYYS